MPPTPPPRTFGKRLRELREATGLTQAEAAEKVDVSRANFAQWETGKHLPTEWRIAKLDEILGAGGSLIAVAGTVRPIEQPRLAARPTKSLIEVWGDVRTSLLDQLVEDQHPPGWRHNLLPNGEPPSMLSTTYGLKALTMLGGPHPSTSWLVDTVMRHASRDSEGRIVGWAGRTQPAPTMETTSTALDALQRAGALIAADEVVRVLGALVDETARQRPFILTCALEPLIAVAPESELVEELVDALLACRLEGQPLWPEKREATVGTSDPRPSVAHTARAITVLRKAPGEHARDAVAAAESWIAETGNLDGVAEVIRRTAPTYSEFTIHHFTAAWVVRATAGNPELRGALGRALDYVWDRFSHTLHLWKMDNGDAPVWMLADAVAALHDAALAMFATPIDRDVG